MRILISPYQADKSRLQADVSIPDKNNPLKYKRWRWLVPIKIHGHLGGQSAIKACEKWAGDQLLAKLNEPEKEKPVSELTVDDFFPRWLQAKQHELKIQTVDNYTRAYNNHIKPFWGNRKLVSLADPSLMLDFKVELFSKTRMKVGSKGQDKTANFVGKNKLLASQSTNNIQACLSSIINVAHGLHLIPAKLTIKFQRTKKTDLSDKKYTLAQQKLIVSLALAMDPIMGAAILLGLDTGLRRGELCGISWESVDFHNSAIDVKEQLYRSNGEVIIDTTKGAAAKVAMSARVAVALDNIKPKGATGLIFGIMPYKLNDWVKKILTKANEIDSSIKIRRSFHAFRHNCASNLADNRFYIKGIQEHLRHASLDTTQIYIHSESLEKTKEALDLIGTPIEYKKIALVK